MHFEPHFEFRWFVKQTRKSLQIRHWQGKETGWGEWADIPLVYDEGQANVNQNLGCLPVGRYLFAKPQG